jgi:hypothetical protein
LAAPAGTMRSADRPPAETCSVCGHPTHFPCQRDATGQRNKNSDSWRNPIGDGAHMWSRRNERLTRLPCKVYLRRRGSRLQRRYSTLLNLPALGGHMPVGTGFGIRFLRATPRSNTFVSPPVFRFCRPQW